MASKDMTRAVVCLGILIVWLLCFPGLLSALGKSEGQTPAAWVQAIAAAGAIIAVVWQSLFQTRAAEMARKEALDAREEERRRLQTSLVYRLAPVTSYIENGTKELMEQGRFFSGSENDVFSLNAIIEIAFFDERDFNSNIYELGHEAAKEFAQMCFFIRNVKATIPLLANRVESKALDPRQADHYLMPLISAANENAQRLLAIIKPFHD